MVVDQSSPVISKVQVAIPHPRTNHFVRPALGRSNTSIFSPSCQDIFVFHISHLLIIQCSSARHIRPGVSQYKHLLLPQNGLQKKVKGFFGGDNSSVFHIPFCNDLATQWYILEWGQKTGYRYTSRGGGCPVTSSSVTNLFTLQGLWQLDMLVNTVQLRFNISTVSANG